MFLSKTKAIFGMEGLYTPRDGVKHFVANMESMVRMTPGTQTSAMRNDNQIWMAILDIGC